MGLMSHLSRLRARYRALVETYGKVAITVWFSIFGLTWLGFYVALSLGVDLSAALRSAAGSLGRDPDAWAALGGGAGRVGIAYAVTQVTKPLRLLLTLALTRPSPERWAGRPRRPRLRPAPPPRPSPGGPAAPSARSAPIGPSARRPPPSSAPRGPPAGDRRGGAAAAGSSASGGPPP